jgi:hypothetical protein
VGADADFYLEIVGEAYCFADIAAKNDAEEYRSFAEFKREALRGMYIPS